MAEGIKALRKIQLGRETTAGSAVASSTRWRGMGTILNDREVIFPEEDVGFLVGVDRSYTPRIGAQLSMESTPATFEQVLHVLEAGVKTASPVADGSGSGYIYTYDFPTTAANTIKTYTIEGGDNIQAEEMEYAFVSSFTLSGAAREAWMMSADWRGRQVTKTTFTAEATATLPDVEEMLFSKSALYIDAATGTAGTTQVSNTLLSAELSVTTGWMEVYTAEGNLYFSFTKQAQPEITLNVTFEHNASAVAQKDAWIAETPKLVQLKCTGSAFTTAGTAYSAKTMIINLAGKWESFEAIGEQDGNDIISGTFRARYNADAGMVGQIIVVNDLSAVQ